MKSCYSTSTQLKTKTKSVYLSLLPALKIDAAIKNIEACTPYVGVQEKGEVHLNFHSFCPKKNKTFSKHIILHSKKCQIQYTPNHQWDLLGT